MLDKENLVNRSEESPCALLRVKRRLIQLVEDVRTAAVASASHGKGCEEESESEEERIITPSSARRDQLIRRIAEFLNPTI